MRALVQDGTDVLLTTQYLDEADQLADRVAVIDRGRKVAEGTPNELKADVGNSTLYVQLTDADRTVLQCRQRLFQAVRIRTISVSRRSMRLSPYM